MAAGWRRQSMDTQKRARLEITDRQGNRILSENLAGQTAIATLQGTALSANRGTSLNLDWVESVRVNLSAVERRAATIVTRRTVKKDWRSEEHTSELQSRQYLVCRLLLEKKNVLRWPNTTAAE